MIFPRLPWTWLSHVEEGTFQREPVGLASAPAVSGSSSKALAHVDLLEEAPPGDSPPSCGENNSTAQRHPRAPTAAWSSEHKADQEGLAGKSRCPRSVYWAALPVGGMGRGLLTLVTCWGGLLGLHLLPGAPKLLVTWRLQPWAHRGRAEVCRLPRPLPELLGGCMGGGFRSDLGSRETRLGSQLGPRGQWHAWRTGHPACSIWNLPSSRRLSHVQGNGGKIMIFPICSLKPTVHGRKNRFPF